MARLTDNKGRLLGGLQSAITELSLAGNFLPLGGMSPGLQSPVSPPHTPAFGPEEVVFALECSYGSFAYLSYSAGIANPAARTNRPVTYSRQCWKLIEEPQERHYCPSCGGYYCANHAKPAAHDCAQVIRPDPV